MGRSGAPLPVDRQLCFAVYSTAHALNRTYKPLLEPLGITYPQYLVMLVLWKGDGLTVKAIGAHLHLDSGTLTPLLKRLEVAGLVRRERDAADERQVRIRLTDAGRAMGQKAGAIGEAIFEATGLSPKELDDLHSSLARLRDRLRKQTLDGDS